VFNDGHGPLNTKVKESLYLRVLHRRGLKWIYIVAEGTVCDVLNDGYGPLNIRFKM
jgi:hypothetical protein